MGDRLRWPNQLWLDLCAALLASVALPAAACSSSSSHGGSPSGMEGGVMESGLGDSAAPSDAPGDTAPDDAGGCGLLPVGATCTAASQCCQSGSGLPEGQACFTVSGSSTRTCRPRCNSSSECAAGSCCIPDGSSFPPLGSAPTEPGGFCYPEAAGSAVCIVGYANGYVCTGNDNTSFVCNPAMTDAGPSGSTCLAGVTTYCACAAGAGQPCSSSAESVDYAECINGAPSVFACYAGYETTADAGGCTAAVAACAQ